MRTTSSGKVVLNWRRRFMCGLAVPMTFLGVAVAASPANAMAYTKNVYAPSNVSGSAEGWADISQDCSGTLGCYSYGKIERWGWFGNSWIGGGWLTGSGWHKIVADLPEGCGYYRTTVDSYNYASGPIEGQINLGPIGGGAGGQTIYNNKLPWSSGWSYLCS
ncbi:hypothetical protein [Modestobacter lapidis]